MWLQQVKAGKVVRQYQVSGIAQAEDLVALMSGVRSFALIVLAQKSADNPQLDECIHQVLDSHEIYGGIADMIQHFDDCEFQVNDWDTVYKCHPDTIHFLEVDV